MATAEDDAAPVLPGVRLRGARDFTQDHRSAGKEGGGRPLTTNVETIVQRDKYTE